MKAIYFNHWEKEDGYKVVDIKDDLKAFYELLHCNLIDIAVRSIGGINYNIIIDDEGFYHKPCVLGASNPYDQDCILMNSLLVTGSPDGEGNLTSLTDDDINNIMNSMHPFFYKEDGQLKGRDLLKIDWMQY